MTEKLYLPSETFTHKLIVNQSWWHVSRDKEEEVLAQLYLAGAETVRHADWNVLYYKKIITATYIEGAPDTLTVDVNVYAGYITRQVICYESA